MLVMSNHITTANLNIPQKAVVRINVAWVKSRKELNRLLDNCKNEVLLDYPSGRFKPPTPVISLEEAIGIANDRGIITHFAVSNAEDKDQMAHLRGMLNEEITLIPKIETEDGIKNILDICNAAGTIWVMLDKDDLYMNVGKDEKKFISLIAELHDVCKPNNIHILTLRGVIFSDE